MSIDEAIRFLEAIFGPFGPESGVAAEAIVAAGAQLEVQLPRALGDLYRRTGLVQPLHGAHNAIVPVESLGFGGDHLIFYEENQAVVVWGIERSRLSEDDPPVDQGQPVEGKDDEWTFHPEFRSVSEFACAQGAWQAVQGGLPFVGVWEQPEGARKVDADVMTSAFGRAFVTAVSMRAWLVAGGVLVDAGDGYLGLATREAEQFASVSARLAIDIDDWDYATLRDE